MAYRISKLSVLFPSLDQTRHILGHSARWVIWVSVTSTRLNPLDRNDSLHWKSKYVDRIYPGLIFAALIGLDKDVVRIDALESNKPQGDALSISEARG